MDTLNNLSRFVYDAAPELPTLLLFMLLALALYIIRRSEVKDSPWADVFNDEAGKRSTQRVATLVALAVSSAGLMFVMLNYKANLELVFNYFVAYLAIWSGAAVVSKFLDVMAAKLAK